MNEQTTTGLSSEPSPYTSADPAHPAGLAGSASANAAPNSQHPQPERPGQVDQPHALAEASGATPLATQQALGAPAQPPAPSRRRARTRPPKAADALAEGGGDAHDARETPTHKRRRVTRITDSGRMPALRLNRMDGRAHQERRPTMVYDTEHAPGYLRGLRLLVGLALLALAWGVSLLVAMLTISLQNGLPHRLALSERYGLYVFSALAILWLALLALGLIVVGALSLTLALTRRGW